MIGVLIVAGLIFYAVLYSGVKGMQGEPVSTLDALLGNEPAATTTTTGTRPQREDRTRAGRSRNTRER